VNQGAGGREWRNRLRRMHCFIQLHRPPSAAGTLIQQAGSNGATGMEPNGPIGLPATVFLGVINLCPVPGRKNNRNWRTCAHMLRVLWLGECFPKKLRPLSMLTQRIGRACRNLVLPHRLISDLIKQQEVQELPRVNERNLRRESQESWSPGSWTLNTRIQRSRTLGARIQGSRALVGRSQNRSHPNGLRPHGSHLIDGLAPEQQAGVGATARIKRNLQVANVLGSVLTKALIGWRNESTESQRQTWCAPAHP